MPISSLQEIDFRAEPRQKLLPLWLAGNSESQDPETSSGRLRRFMSEMII